MSEIQYVTTKEVCEANIKGVCEGCGGALTAIETVDNSRRPTFWQGCEHCSCFRSGVERKYFEVARLLVERGELKPYGHTCRVEYENSPERLAYYFDSQTAGLSHTIKRIDCLLNAEKSNDTDLVAISEREVLDAAKTWVHKVVNTGTVLSSERELVDAVTLLEARMAMNATRHLDVEATGSKRDS